MKAATPRQRGVSGSAKSLPDQGAEIRITPSDETLRQSCPTDSSGHSTQFRIRLPARHAKRWLSLSPKLREHVAGVVFGTLTEGIKLEELVSAERELRLTRIAITNALQLSLARGASLDTQRIDEAVGKINRLLGGRKP